MTDVENAKVQVPQGEPQVKAVVEVDDVAAPKLFNTLAEWAAAYMEVSEKVPVKVSEIYEGEDGVGSKRKLVPKDDPDSSEKAYCEELTGLVYDIVDGSRYSYRSCDGGEKPNEAQPMANFRGVVEVVSTGPKGCCVTWSGWYDAVPGKTVDLESLFKLFIEAGCERCRVMSME